MRESIFLCLLTVTALLKMASSGSSGLPVCSPNPLILSIHNGLPYLFNGHAPGFNASLDDIVNHLLVSSTEHVICFACSLKPYIYTLCHILTHSVLQDGEG